MNIEQRRGFLRGLATLPLIGGSVALVGRPTAVAAPVTPDLLHRYWAWLANEHAAMAAEIQDPAFAYEQEIVRGTPAEWAYYRVRTPLFHFPAAPDIERAVYTTRPSTRAALVLSAVGVGLG